MIFDIPEHHMMLGYVKNRQPVLFHSHPGQGCIMSEIKNKINIITYLIARLTAFETSLRTL